MEATYMTDYQYQAILKSIKMILSGCGSIEEAQKKIDELLDKDPAPKEKKSTRSKKK